MKLFLLLLLFSASVAALFLSPVAQMSDKLQFVGSHPDQSFADLNDKLKFVGHSGVETKAERDARMKWWREARFGMFIHWGLYAVPAGEYNGQRSTRIGEWIMEWANIPRADYEKFAPQFNPVKFNARSGCAIAKDAGMKYIVITSKHHDGFAMYDSDVSKYDIVDATPYHKDPIKALAAGSEEAGSEVLLLLLDSRLASPFRLR